MATSSPSSVGVFDTGLVIRLLESAKGKAETHRVALSRNRKEGEEEKRIEG